jgi:hypothetical protein
MRRRLRKMVSASSSIASGHAAYASPRPPSIGGSRTWLPAQSCADGSGMTPTDGSSSAGGTRLNSPIKVNSSASFGRSREIIRSRSSLRLATSCITKPSFSGTFLQIEPVRCRRVKCTTFSLTRYVDADRSLLAKCSIVLISRPARLCSALPRSPECLAVARARTGTRPTSRPPHL